MRRRRSTKSPRFSANAFSLVEVALAIGIVSFVLVSLLGLMTSGLSNFRSAMSYTIESQIVEGLASDLTLGSFSTLATYANGAPPIFYFDDAGVKQATNADWRYKTTMVVAPVGSSNSPVAFKNESGGNVTNTTAYNVLITINRFSDNPNQSPQDRHQYSIIVANSGQ